MNRTFRKQLHAWMGILLLLSMTGCADEYDTVPTTPSGKNVYMTLSLLASGANGAGTRSLTPSEEKSVDNVSVLVFRRASSSEEGTLAYQAQADQVKPSGDAPGRYTALVTLLQSVSNEEYSVVVVANCGTDVGYKYYGQTKSYVQQHLTYAYTDRWAANLDGKEQMTPFPMWGETAYEVLNKASSFNGKKEIRLLRALARMDVGLKYKKTSTVESFEGIKGFRLETIHVYRVPNKGFVIPDATNYSDTLVSAPSVPSDITLLKPGKGTGQEDDGLIYTADVEGTESGVMAGMDHSIYLPENTVGTDDKNTTLVVGITDLSSGRLRYYKLKMKSNTASGKIEPVLRNYRYVYSITGVTGMGYDTPEDALNGVDGGIDYSVISWNDINSDLWMSGQYYFKVDKNIVKLHSQASNNATLHYETNLPFDRIKWEWSSVEAPNTTFVETYPAGSTTEGVLTFTADENDQGKDLTNVLKFTAGDLTGTVSVVQSHINMGYTIVCPTVADVHGNYTLNTVADPATQYITLKLTGIDPEAIGLKWKIQTNKINGLWFHGEGIFTATEQDVVIYADAVIGDDGNPEVMSPVSDNKFTITGNNIGSEGTTVNTCEVHVVIGYKAKKILGLTNVYPSGGTSDYYGITGPAVSVYLKAKNNYSLSSDAIFPMPLDYEKDVTALINTPADILKNLGYAASGTTITDYDAAPHPDIVFIGFNIRWDNTSAVGNALKNYVDRGGVVICGASVHLNPIGVKYGPYCSGLQNLVDNEISNLDAKIATLHSHQIDTRVGNIPADDPIYSGIVPGVKNPISLNGMYWEEDRNTGSGFPLTHPDRFVIYAYTGDGTSEYNGQPNFIRFKERNVILIGDEQWMCNTTTHALQFDENQRPVHSTGNNVTNYKGNGDNAQILENILHWAIYQAEFHGINSGGLDGVDRPTVSTPNP